MASTGAKGALPRGHMAPFPAWRFPAICLVLAWTARPKALKGQKTRSPSALLPFSGWEGSPTKIDYRKKGTLILTSLLEDLMRSCGSPPIVRGEFHFRVKFSGMSQISS